MINLIVKDLIESDDGFTIRQEKLMYRDYVAASDEEREIVDQMFIYLCGYSFETILEKRRDNDITRS